MSTPRHDRCWPWWAALAVAGGAAQASAQARFQQPDPDPQWLKLNVKDASAGMYAEGTYDTATFKNSGAPSTHDRLFIGPSLGLNLDGSIYHPSLFNYSLGSEGAFGWAQDSSSYGGATTRYSEMDYLGHFYGVGKFVENLSLNGSVFGGYDHDFRDYDFFNRVTVDTWRYGARAGWTHEPFSLMANYTHRDEDINALSGLSSAHEDIVGLNARHLRDTGQTSLDYSFTDYNRMDYGSATSGDDHIITLADNERFGSHEQNRLDSSVNYARHDFITEPSDELSALVNLLLEHSPKLSTSYGAVYDRYQTDGFTSDSLALEASLQHQLYENLSSGLLVHGSDYETSGESGSGFNRRYGVGLNLNYFRNLSSTARLSLNNALLADHVDQQNINVVHNEAHSFLLGAGGAGPNSFFLNLPEVRWSSIVVWRTDHTQQFVSGIDYQLTLNGAITQLERLAGSLMPDNVVVDYETEPSSAGSYETLSETFGARLDLFHNLWGLYGRMNFSRNNAAVGLRIPDYTSYTLGSDLNWRWARAGAEYSFYDSTFSSYRVERLFQSLRFRLDSASTLGVEFSEAWTDYLSAQRQEQDYRVMVHFHRSLSRRLRLDVQGGYDWRRGPGVDQDLATFRADLGYSFGRFNLMAGYDFEQDIFLETEFRDRHLFTLRLKRSF